MAVLAYTRAFFVDELSHISRLTIVSREAKKKQQ